MSILWIVKYVFIPINPHNPQGNKKTSIIFISILLEGLKVFRYPRFVYFRWKMIKYFQHHWKWIGFLCLLGQNVSFQFEFSGFAVILHDRIWIFLNYYIRKNSLKVILRKKMKRKTSCENVFLVISQKNISVIIGARNPPGLETMNDVLINDVTSCVS